MKRITLFIFLCCFILFRPYQLQSTGMLYYGDDDSYMAHATSIVFFQFPSYANEYFSMGKGCPLHSIGPSLLATPFVFLFSIIDRLSSSSILVQRTALNVSQSWSVFGFTISSLFYLWITCLLLFRGLRLYFSSRICSLTVILSVLVQGIPLFALRRPAFSHIYEIFLQSLLLFIFLRLFKLGFIFSNKDKYVNNSILIGFIISFIVLVRFNNPLIALVWPVVLFSLYYPKISKTKILGLVFISWLFIPLMFFVFQVIPVLYNLHCIHPEEHAYYKTFVLLFAREHLIFYLKRIWGLIFGADFGLFFSAPYILIGLISMFWIRKERICKYICILLLPLFVNLYMVIRIGCIGSWYGYRYIIFSLIPIIVYPLARTLSLLQERNRKLFIFVIILSVFPILSMISFEGNNTNLTLKVIDEGFGVLDWGNNNYQMEIYKTIITSPFQYLTYILKGGACYFVYLFSILLKQNNLPAVIYEKYKMFQAATFIKTMIVYIFPFLLLFIYNRSISGRGKSIKNGILKDND